MVGPILRRGRTSLRCRFEARPRPKIGILTFVSRSSIRTIRTSNSACTRVSIEPSSSSTRVSWASKIKWAPSSRQRMAQSRFTSPGIHWAVRSLKLRRPCLAAIRLGLATLMVRRASAILISIYVKVPSYRVLNYADIVPQVPLPIVYRHSGDPRYMPDHVTSSPYRFQPNVLERGWQMVRGLIQLIKAGSILGIEDHAISAYCQKLNAIAEARDQSR